MATINCTVTQGGKILLCNGIEYDEKVDPIDYHDTMFWVYLSLYAGLVLLAGLVSGLTLGLLSIDMTSLLVLREAGTPAQRRHAKRILPLVKRHHLLLVTLLLTNAAAVEMMPLFLDRISDPITAILVSVTAVLFFGEVFPQAICSRYGLAIGATLAPVVYVMVFVCFPIAYPLSKLLDCLLGKEHATFFRRAELKALVDLHGPTGAGGHEHLTYDEVLIIKGALELRDKTVKDAMVPLENVFMLDVDTKLNNETKAKLLAETHSRVPVYEGRRQNVIGILLVKTLINHESSDAVTLRSLLKDSHVSRRVHFAPERMPLYELLNRFQKGKAHLAVVTSCQRAPDHSLEISMRDQAGASCADSGEVVGIITLEDILEEILQEEIIDETDVYVDVRTRIKVARARAFLSRSASAQAPDLFASRSTVTMDTTPSLPRRYLSIPNDPQYMDNQRLMPGTGHSDTTPLLN